MGIIGNRFVSDFSLEVSIFRKGYVESEAEGFPAGQDWFRGTCKTSGKPLPTGP